MIHNTDNTFQQHLQSLQRDAVSWKAQLLWAGAAGPDEQAAAIDDMVTMLLAIGNENKRTQYIELLQRENKIKNQLLKKTVKEILVKQEQKRQAELAQKKLEANIEQAEDVGLPAGMEKGKIHDALKYGIYEWDNVYYTRGLKGGDYPVTNFTMQILHHIDSDGEASFRLIKIKNVYGFEAFININTDDFVSLGTFKKVIARRGDFIFKGAETDLCRLQELLQKDETKSKLVQVLGWHRRGKFYAFGNGVFDCEANKFQPIDEYGMVEVRDKTWFIPATSKMFAEKDDQFVNEKKFVYKPEIENFHFKEWAQLYMQAYGNKAIPAILFYIGTLFRDVIMKQIQRYPILCLFGPPGAGKGQVAESILSMFGEKQDQIMLGGASTVVGFMRKFAQFSNAIVWLDEYKNNLPIKFIESIKNIYDGKGYERGKMTNDFTTESTPIHSSCILSGQDMPTIEPALFMRTIMLSFEDGKFTAEQRKAFQQLKEIEMQGLSYITAWLLQFRSIIEENFKDTQLRIFKQTLDEVHNNEVDDRMIMNISLLLTIHELMYRHIELPFTYKDASAFLRENMLHQHTILAGNNDLAKFWQVIESLSHQELVQEGRDFELENGNIYLCLSKVHPLYLKEMRQRGDMNYLSKPTMEHYLQLDKTVYVTHQKKRFHDGSNNWVYVLKYDRLNVEMKLKQTSPITEGLWQAPYNEKEPTPQGENSLPF